MNSILILRGGALGDFLVTLPLLKALRRRWPESRIELVGNRSAAELAVLDGCLDAAHGQEEARWARFYSSEELDGPFRSWLETFDLVLGYWPDPAGELARHFPLRVGQRFVVGGAAVESRPAAAHFFLTLDSLELPAPEFSARLNLPAALQEEAERRLPFALDRIALHPGSGAARKNWPLERWEALVAALSPSPLLLILGEADASAAARFRALDEPRIQKAEQWPLPPLAAALAQCRLFVGHDTGIAHLAAAVGTPCLLLFGPTDPAVWAPPGAHIRVLRHGERLEDLSVDAVRSIVAPR